MRNISFSLTEEQFLNGSKDVTRRLGWLYLKPSDRLMACRKCMGLKPGEKIVRLGEIEVVSVRREPLDRMTNAKMVSNHEHGYGGNEARREGFPFLSGDQFVVMFCKHMKCKPETVITRIEFKRVGGTMQNLPTALNKIGATDSLMTDPETSMIEAEISRVARAGGCCGDLSRAAYEHLYHLNMERMPYGTAKARTGDPYEWLDQHALPEWIHEKELQS